MALKSILVIALIAVSAFATGFEEF
jgi:hypothetical protein